MTSPAPSAAAVVDPFGASAQPARYVPRAATERALDALVEIVVSGRSAVLAGIPGVGKTLLLHLLAERIAPEIRCVYLPYPSLPLGALCAWALEELGAPPTYDAPGALVGWARRDRDDGRGLLLAIDDAESLPEAALRELARMAQDSRGELRIVAAVDMARAESVREALGEVALVALRARMSDEETCAYVRGHLEAAHVPPGVADRFDARTLAALHERSGGLPIRVNAEASAVLRAALERSERAARTTAEQEAAAFERAAGRLALAERGTAGDAADPAFERAVGRLVLAQSTVEQTAAAEPAAEASPASEPSPAAEPSPSIAPAAEPSPSVAPESVSPARARQTLTELIAADASPLDELAARADAPPPAKPAPLAAKPAPVAAEPAPAAAKPAPVAAAPLVRRTRTAPPSSSPHTPTAVPGIARRWRRAAGVVGICFVVGTAAGILLARRADSPGLGTETAATPAVSAPAAPSSPVEVPAPAAREAAAAEARSAGPTAAVEAASPAPTAAVEAASPAPTAAVEATSPVPTAAVEAAPPAPPAVAATATPAPVAVQINATPWALIHIDGREVGITPLSGVQVSAGEHAFEAHFPDGRVESRRVAIDAENRYVAFE